jgi:anti-anti-sigma factor
VDGELNGFVVTGAPGVSHLAMHGDVDRAEAETLRLALLGFVPITRYRVELDLTDVGFFGRAAAQAVAEAWEESMLHGSNFVIVGMSDTVRRAFGRAGLDGLVRTVYTAPTAAQADFVTGA